MKTSGQRKSFRGSRAFQAGILSALFLFAGSSLSFANLNQLKVYKEAFPETKAQCAVCHVDKLPKKDEGLHDLNEYGQTVKEAMVDDELSVEALQEIGPAPAESQ